MTPPTTAEGQADPSSAPVPAEAPAADSEGQDEAAAEPAVTVAAPATMAEGAVSATTAGGADGAASGSADRTANGAANGAEGAAAPGEGAVGEGEAAPEAEQQWPLISLVVPTVDDSRYLRGLLRSVEKLDYPMERLEVILIGDRRNDNLEELKERFDRLNMIILYYPLRPGRKRNIGVDRARGELIAFTDDDCILREDWLTKGVVHLRENPDYVGVGGPNFTPPNEPPFAQAVGRIFGSRFLFSFRYTTGGRKPHPIDHNPTCNYLLLKEVAAQVRFHDTLFPGEDVEFDIRVVEAGHKLLYAPNMVVWHHRRMGPAAFAAQMYSYGKTRANVVLMHPHALQLRHFAFMLAFWAMAGLWIGAYLGNDWRSPDWLPLLGQVGQYWLPLALTLFYFVVIGLAGLLVGFQARSWKMLAYTPVVLVIQHFVYSLGLMVGLFRKV